MATMWEVQVEGLVQRHWLELSLAGGDADMDGWDVGRAVRDPYCLDCGRWVDANAVRHHQQAGHDVDVPAKGGA
jgi:hypothetical protein